jgi:hypothetical protein
MKTIPSSESLFNTLKAENEPWLSEVFIALPAFERLKENHSTFLYGEAGSGKTALRLELKKQNETGIFNVLWILEPILENPHVGTALAHQAMRQALRTCVESLILDAKLPQRLKEPPSHIAAALQWFLRNYLPFDAGFYMRTQANQLAAEERQWYLVLLEQSFSSIVTEQTSLKDQIRLLLAILRQAQYERLWLTIDGLERWTSRQAGEQVIAFLDAVLSTLIIFDVPGVTYKFFLPASLKGIVHNTIGAERHRAEEVQLEWSLENLQAMLEERLDYAFSSEKNSLSSLCEANQFLSWLIEFGGSSPRAWLQFTAPLVAEYRKVGKRLDGSQTYDFIRRHPAPLWLHHERREVWLGKKCIPIGSVPEFRVLEYLFTRPGKISSLENLYYYAQLGQNNMPDKVDPRWVREKNWRGAMDTMIWRLRQKIEQNPREPLYLVTRHGKGLELLHAET